MSRLATMGTSSCGTIAIQEFKKVGNKSGMDVNEAYIADPKSFTAPEGEGENSATDFYNNVLYPTIQELGRTKQMPFEMLMQQIDAHLSLRNKFTIATINHSQFMLNDYYWPRQLEKWGFVYSHATKNSTMGMGVNHIYIRDLHRTDLNTSFTKKKEEETSS